jgi:hypothetical protein
MEEDAADVKELNEVDNEAAMEDVIIVEARDDASDDAKDDAMDVNDDKCEDELEELDIDTWLLLGSDASPVLQ